MMMRKSAALSAPRRLRSLTHNLSLLVGRRTSASSATNNPLLHHQELPAYGLISHEHVVPGITSILDTCETDLAELEMKIESSTPGQISPGDMFDPLSSVFDRIGVGWGAVSHLKAVRDSDGLRTAVEEVLPARVQFGLRVAQSKQLYSGFKDLLKHATLSEPETRACEAEIRDAELTGIGLQDASRFNEIQQELSTLRTEFSNNLIDATKSYSYKATSHNEIAGIPENILGVAAANAVASGCPGATTESGPWLLTLDDPCYMAVVQHCSCRSTREKIFRAYTTRASDKANPIGQDNTELINRTLDLRQEAAKLLGYENYAEQSCASKMATVDDAISLLHQLKEAAYPVAVKESIELHQFAIMNGHPEDEELAPYDRSYYSKRLMEKKYDYSEEEVKLYFPMDRVLNGLFKLCGRLFGISVRKAESQPSVWNEYVDLYEVFSGDHMVAKFYLDPYARPAEKRGGAWMDECISKAPGRLPVAHIVCNQAAPSASSPALMTFRDVQTLFHEFGHALQHMLTEQELGFVAGIRGVEWDAVEIPSQFMENWCYDDNTVRNMAFHHETGAPIPEELFNRIKASRNFMSGTATLRQVHFAMIDMRLHMNNRNALDKDPHRIPFELAKEGYQVNVPVPYDRFLCAFSHIFAGPYAAGYFSYKWSEVLSADCFSAFEDANLHDENAVSRTGLAFRNTFLAQGGGRSPSAVFEEFRGRAPSIDALVRHTGLDA